MILSGLLQLALWTICATAFYPFSPAWHEEQERLVALKDAKHGAARGGTVLRVEKRIGKRVDPPAVLASRQALWLKSKFQRSRVTIPAENLLEKRSTNSYPIVPAAQPTVSMATGVAQDGTDFAYFVKAQIGSKGKELYMLLDTGAGSSWVMGSTCTDKPCTAHTTFGPGDSDTFTDTRQPFNMSYGSGTVRGSLVTDTVNVAGINVKYSFGLASNASDDFTHFAFDGILGMSMSQGASENFLKTLTDGQKVENNIFGVALSRAADGNGGEVRIGAINPAKYSGEIGYTSVGSKDGDWAIPIDDMSYDGKKAGCGGILAYIDTGTSFIFGPSDSVKKLHAVVPGSASPDSSTYTVPCDSNKTLSFTFSGVDYQLSAKDWIAPKDSSGQCTSNIYARDVVNGAWLLGDTFLKNVYTVFDKDKKRIGLAAAANSQRTQSGSASSSSSASSDQGATATVSTSTSAAAQSTPSADATKPMLGLNGHETVDGGVAGTAASKPTNPSDSSAAAQASTQQRFLVAVFVLGATLLVTRP